MNKILLGLMVLIIAVGCGSNVKTREPSSLVRHIGNSTIALMVVGSVSHDEPRPYCSGVWVGTNAILTANHCVEAAWKMEMKRKIMQMEEKAAEAAISHWLTMSHVEHLGLVVIGTPIYYSSVGDVDEVGKSPYALRLGTVAVVDPTHDLALIIVSGTNLPAHDIAVVADENPGIGERLHIVGQPRGLYWSYIEGVVSAYRKSLPENRSIVTEVNELDVVGPYMQVSGPVWYGNSRGGAFDTEEKLVGIASFLTGAPVSCHFIHPDVIRSLLAEHLK
jgi:hypothetical protein